MDKGKPTRWSKRSRIRAAGGLSVLLILMICGWVVFVAWRDSVDSVRIVRLGPVGPAPRMSPTARKEALATAAASVRVAVIPGVGGSELLTDSNRSGKSKSSIPPLEIERARSDVLTALQDAASEIPLIRIAPVAPADSQPVVPAFAPDTVVRVISGFEGSSPIAVREISATRFEVTLTANDAQNWFMFRVEGAAGKTVRLDIRGQQVMNWWSLNPLYCYGNNLDGIDATDSIARNAASESSRAWNGPTLPDTHGQKWHHMPNAWMGTPHTFSFVHHFETDGCYIAMRAPYTPNFNERYLASIAARPEVHLHVAGKSKEGRPLQVVEIGNGSRTANPCVLLYGREHADEQDSSWAVKGAIDFLLSDSPESVALRDRFTFLAVPVLDPDGAVAGRYANITDSFQAFQETPESIAYSGFFRQWVQAGKRLDLVLNFHNHESAEVPEEFSCALAEPKRNAPRHSECAAINAQLTADLSNAGYLVAPFKPMQTYFSFRLGGWLMGYYGPLHLLYELNTQAPKRHLTILDTEAIGANVVHSVATIFDGPQRAGIMASVDAIRNARAARVSQLQHRIPNQDSAILSEYKMLVLSQPRESELADNFMLR
jgi:hypothetical protein